LKLLTKNTDYAIRALLHIAHNGRGYISSREISSDENIPLPYLRRILNRLREEEIIVTREGVGGGAKINRDPKEIRVSNLIEVFQGKLTLLDCVFRKDICINIKTCPLRRRIKKIENEVIKELEDMTIKDLLDDLNKGDN
jgi:Rrf2 family protein